MAPRIIRSSSQGEISLFSQTVTIESPTPLLKRPRQINSAAKRAPNIFKDSKLTNLPKMFVPIKEHPLKKMNIFTLGSAEREEEEIEMDEELGYFLRKCNLCKKVLNQDADIYMYGYLGAFCSIGCRDDRIALDGLGKEVVLKVSSMHKRSSKKI